MGGRAAQSQLAKPEWPPFQLRACPWPPALPQLIYPDLTDSGISQCRYSLCCLSPLRMTSLSLNSHNLLRCLILAEFPSCLLQTPIIQFPHPQSSEAALAIVIKDLLIADPSGHTAVTGMMLLWTWCSLLPPFLHFATLNPFFSSSFISWFFLLLFAF